LRGDRGCDAVDVLGAQAARALPRARGGGERSCMLLGVREVGRVIVVGSGPAGAAAAVFLSRAGVDVLLLESGSKHAARGMTVRMRGITIFRVHPPLKRRQGVIATADPDAGVFEELAPGGLSNHWSCAVPRFAPEDFADAERAGEPYTWPIGYDDVAPWYDRVESLLHVAGAVDGSSHLPANRVRHARLLGPDWAPLAEQAQCRDRLLAPMPFAYGAETTLTPSGTVFNSFVRLVRPELRAGRLAVQYGAHVVRLEFSANTRRVEAVLYRDARTGAESRIACRAVVLAAGAIRTPEILFRSSSAEFPDGLGNSHGVLGRYLHDHPLAKLVVDLGAALSFHPPSYLTRPGLENAPPLYAAACMQWSGVALLARSVMKRHPARLPWLGFNVFGTMAPVPDNCVALDPKQQGPDGSAALRLHIRHPPEARNALERARDDLVGILSGAGLNPRVRTWHYERACESVHYGGTCRMHRSPQFGMIDGWNRLHAVPNVVVADSAAFTTGPEKNPALTAMALAARAGDHLAEQLKAGEI
jgi:choline dehydrogenase-like flavoprotein